LEFDVTYIDSNKTYTTKFEAAEDYFIKNEYDNLITIYFASPVLVNDLSDLNITLEPSTLGYNFNRGETYTDADGNLYTTTAYINVETSPYSIFKYTIKDNLSYYNVSTHTKVDNGINMDVTNVVQTVSDLNPLEMDTIYIIDDRSIGILFNREVDQNSIINTDENGTILSTSINVSDDLNNTYTIDYVEVYNNDVRISFNEEINTSANTLIIQQIDDIKARGSIYTLPAGSIDTNLSM
jgi:hypothetical protein